MKKENRKKMHILLALFAVVLPMFCLAVMPVQAKAATVKLNSSEKTLVIGKGYQLKVRNTAKSVTWTSGNPRVATVSSDGYVTAKKKGKTTITAKIGSKKLKCKVTVITMQKSYVNKTITLINKERRKYGHPSFDRNALLQSAAQKRAKELSRKFSHLRPNGTKWTSAISMKYDFASASENIGRDFVTPQPLIDAWMRNPATKANIIAKKYDEIGVGVYLGDDGYLYWCAIFAKEK